MKGRKIIFIVTVLAFFTGCGKQSAPVNRQTIDSAEIEKVLTFVREASEKGLYCTSLSSTAYGTDIGLSDGKVFKIFQTFPIVEMDAEGVLTCKGKDLGITLDVRSTWYGAPQTSVGEDRVLEIEGKRTEVTSRGAVIIDCGKYLYFCFDDGTLALPSELRERFNPPLPRDKGILKVLFVGNSFNVDATAHLPGILSANGTRRVLMGRTYHGGCTLPQYNENYSAANHCSYRVCRPGEDNWDGDEEYDTNLEYAVNAEDWDIVTFMEYTGNQCCWSWDATEKEHINSLIDKVFAAHPDKRPTVMFMLTQTFAAQSSLVSTYFGGDQMMMYSTITDFASKVLGDTCIDDVIATGTAVQSLRTSSLNSDKAQDLSRDGFHLDYGVSRYAAACTVFYNIFEPCLGLKLDGNAYRYTEKINLSTAHSIPVTDANVGLCRLAARSATDNPLEVTDLSRF